MLSGKRLLITGVVTKDSIAFEVARTAQLEGAEILLTSFGRARKLTMRTALALPVAADVLELDVNSETDLQELTRTLQTCWGRVDGALHAIAFAPPDALGGRFMETPATSATAAFQTSAYSLKALTAALLPLMSTTNGDGDPSGGAIVGLDFDASVAWPAYDWMGVAKAALESVARYLARDVARHRIRVNLVSAGPLRTLAASGIRGFDELAGNWQRVAPLQWDVEDAGPVADTVRFLLSDLARAITGEIVHVDAGYHAMGAPSGG
jgi:meromycolic acid enoyl-[acyl-carrier-protein] reductase